uniref:Uncharacterized protein n=1 Tax=Engystomops pustulosus TaxID=76066 RepID=A0AAV6YMW9_ENGPU|nr:hypothetical protein GDO81_027051 [Engystomops pustulosus]
MYQSMKKLLAPEDGKANTYLFQKWFEFVIIKPFQIWYPHNETDPKSKWKVYFRGHTQSCKNRALKKMVQIVFLSISVDFQLGI